MASPQSKATVLVVEDPFVRTFVKSYLARNGISAVGLEPGRAVESLRRKELQVEALITNQPGHFAEFAAELPVLYMAAFPDPEQAKPFRHIRMLRKPFRPEELLQAVQELIDE